MLESRTAAEWRRRAAVYLAPKNPPISAAALTPLVATARPVHNDPLAPRAEERRAVITAIRGRPRKQEAIMDLALSERYRVLQAEIRDFIGRHADKSPKCRRRAQAA